MFLAKKKPKETSSSASKEGEATGESSTENGSGGAAAGSASSSGQSIMGKLAPREQKKSSDAVPPAVRRVMTDKESMSERYTSGDKNEQVQVEWLDINDLLKLEVIVKPKQGYVFCFNHESGEGLG